MLSGRLNNRVDRRGRRKRSQVRQKIKTSSRRGRGGGPRGEGGLRAAAVFLRMAVVVGVVGLLGVLLFNAYTRVQASGEFALEVVEVRGTNRLFESEIKTASGLKPGLDLLSVSLKEVENRVEALPRVKDATVIRRLPGTIVIEVKEYSPVALLEWGGSMTLVNEEGVYFPVLTDREQWNLPIITGLEYDKTVRPGSVINQPALKNALKVLAALDPATLAVTSEINAASSGSVTLFTTGRTTRVIFGREDYARKAARLAQAREIFAERGEIKRVIDLRYDDLVTRP